MSVDLPIVNAGLKYVNGLEMAWATTTTFTIAAGSARNSSNLNDITLNAPVTILSTRVGVNGVDLAAVAASTMYAVYLIGDSTKYMPSAAILTLAINAGTGLVATAPSLPSGYDMYRRIGYVKSDGSSLFLKFWQYGHANEKGMYYDTPIATAAITTSADTYQNQSLVAGIPPIACETVLKITFTPETASDIATFVPYGSSPTVGMIAFGYGSATTVPQVGMAKVPCALNTVAPTIAFKTTADTPEALVIAISGYVDSL